MSIAETLSRPEHTGDDRCWPCTVVNLVLVALASLLTIPVSGPGAFLLFAGGAALIYLRGYVVPGTPAFAPRLVRALGLTPYFEHVTPETGVRPERESDDLDDDHDAAALLGEMLRAGVLVERSEDLYLGDAFEAAWTEELRGLRDADEEALAAATATAVPFDGAGTPRFDGISVEGEDGVVWLRPVHARADVAAVRAMAGFDVPEGIRAAAASPLRLFLPECPDCGGALAETTVVDGCCGGTMTPSETPNRRVVACDDCGVEVRDLGAVGVDEERPDG